MKIRMKFRKYGVMKFIGHLDIMRYFQKCMRRGGIDIAYSGGFSPHQIMSFAAPLGVGITSDGEYVDIEVNSTESSAVSLKKLNAVMVEGIEVTSYRKLKDTDKKAMSLVAAADYKVYLKNGYEVPQINYEEAYREFYVEPHEILITKQTKKSEKVMDLKKLLYDFQILYEEGKPVFYLKVCTGSTDNVKPELVLEAFYQSMGLVLDPLSIQIHRLDVYGWRGEGLVSLGEMGEVIE
ncbi:MAG: TIGR03936 family radical SAM-associated protein [Lachnospiraceae bacterium]|nr:TIGR03936 family radical SAM-associated protein [Lachnospiraceae bacterium]